ncbi:hypothetical protein F5Y16DRAFT_399611 [Xylariaceae sp. FL0255]|nr:hypothetical protein F5Y16DRAFT_399611 [Xylariaceae sp. FL0255]
MDPVEKLFLDLEEFDITLGRRFYKSHEEFHYKNVQANNEFIRIFQSFSALGSSDADCNFIKNLATYAKEKSRCEMLRTRLGQLALNTKDIPDDGSAKSRQLELYRWISQGRKDEDYPFVDQDHPKENQQIQIKGNHATLPDKLIGTRICAYCKTPNAQEWCAECRRSVSLKVAYCNKDCQKKHWVEHKTQCRGRRSIHRAVSLIRDLFFMVQKEAWQDDIGLDSITEKDGITNISQVLPLEWRWRRFADIRPFPSHIVSCKELALASMANTQCQWVLYAFDDIIKALLLPLCQELREVVLIPRNGFRPTSVMFHDNSGVLEDQLSNTMFSSHTVLHATVKSGEQIIIDITGAQFGWQETVALAGPWLSHRAIDKAFSFEHFGSARENVEQRTQSIHNINVAQHLSLVKRM